VSPDQTITIIQGTAALAAIGLGMICSGYRNAVFAGIAVWVVCWVALMLADVPSRYLYGGALVGQEIGRAIVI